MTDPGQSISTNSQECEKANSNVLGEKPDADPKPRKSVEAETLSDHPHAVGSWPQVNGCVPPTEQAESPVGEPSEALPPATDESGCFTAVPPSGGGALVEGGEMAEQGFTFAG